ncbi:MAG TPA: VWA domain-containing protein, partial [Rhodocyclaceae bacterium]|nr:VWA domain-containing protein [Rhodocyclaceae bacterium]
MAELPGGFVPDALEAPLAPLDALPRLLWLQGIVNSVGRLHSRLAWLAELRAALLAGAAP